jgi:nucleoid DNA-binding protein
MAKSKPAKAAAKPAKAAAKPAKKVAKKAATPLLSAPKKDERAYTKSKLVAHLSAAVSARGVGEVSKKQAAAILEELVAIAFKYAPVGAPIPGLGKLVLRKVASRPAREGINPGTGAKITIPAKPASQKLVFRFSKDAKAAFKK